MIWMNHTNEAKATIVVTVGFMDGKAVSKVQIGL
jgi:hypothetical protein